MCSRESKKLTINKIDVFVCVCIICKTIELSNFSRELFFKVFSHEKAHALTQSARKAPPAKHILYLLPSSYKQFSPFSHNLFLGKKKAGKSNFQIEFPHIIIFSFNS
jgi:hypothetical protein